MITLPQWIDCSAAFDRGTATLLELFIYHNEPAGEHAKEFRSLLKAALEEAANEARMVYEREHLRHAVPISTLTKTTFIPPGYALVPRKINAAMAAVIRNEYKVYEAEQDLLDALLVAAEVVPNSNTVQE